MTGPLDVHRVIETSGSGERATHGRKRPAELHDDRAVGVSQAPGEFGFRQGSGQHGQHVGLADQRGGDGRRRGSERRYSGDDLGGEAGAEPVVHVHEGAVEQRIPFGEQGNGATGFQMRGESGGRFLVEFGECSGVSAGMICRPGGEWVAQLLLDGIRRNQVCRDGPRVGLLVDARVVGDDIGFADDPCRFAGDQLGIPWAQADSVEPAGRHSASEASALIAEDVIADPPRRPRTVTNGMSMPWSRDNEARASLDSAAPMNPTGQPTMAAGRGAPSISISKR